MQNDGSLGHNAWTVYLESDDAAKTVEKAVACGGTVVTDAMPVADLGIMAFVVDPAGAGVGVWQPMTAPRHRRAWRDRSPGLVRDAEHGLRQVRGVLS